MVRLLMPLPPRTPIFSRHFPMVPCAQDDRRSQILVTDLTRGWLITHQNCLDGATAALIGMSCRLSPIFTEPDRVAQALVELPDGDPVYLADVSLPASNWPDYRYRVSHLLDHHQTARFLQDDPKATIDMSHSGAALMYHFAVLNGWVMPSYRWERLTQAVERYDLWQPQHGSGQNLNRLFRARGFEWYHSRFGQGWVPFTAEEADHLANIIFDETAFITHHVETSQLVTAGPFTLAGVLLEGDGPVNEVAHTLLERGVDLVLFLKPDGRLSARTRPPIDAAQLMETHFGGGGHARAAGGRLAAGQVGSPESLISLLQEIHQIIAP